MSDDLGFVDLEHNTLQPSTSRSARRCHQVRFVTQVSGPDKD